jgi:exonuclease III
MNLRICTFNTRGICSKDKMLQLKELLDRNKVDVCMLQETYISNVNVLREFEWIMMSYDVYAELTEDKSKGVAILIKKELANTNIKRFVYDKCRYACVEIEFVGIIISLVCVYVPNKTEDQMKFINKLYKLIDKKNLTIMGGDFNFVENKQTDRKCAKSGTSEHEGSVSKNIKEWRKMLNLFDMVECDKLENEMTWSSGQRESRIDRFYLIKNKNKNSSIKMKYLKTIVTALSDHRLVLAEIELKSKEGNEQHKYKNYSGWKLNERVLESGNVDKFIIAKCNEIKALKVSCKKNWYDVFIKQIINKLKGESRIMSENNRKEINELYDRLNKLSKTGNLSEENAQEIKDVKTRIKKHYKDKEKGIEKRACEAKRNFLNQPSKILIEREIMNARKNEIKNYMSVNGSETTDCDEIMDDVFAFYKDLMGEEKISIESLHGYEFKVKKLKQIDDSIDLGYKITYEEAAKVVEKMKDTAPGANGLTIGFYKKYFRYFGEHFVDMLNNCEDELCECFNEIVIKLIPKNKNKTKSVNDLRPISLTNFEYRIFTKILSDRLRNISHKLISSSQTCSIIGRRMNDNLCLTRDLIEDAKTRMKSLNILSADQRKAFDSISHNYLFRLLEHIELGDFMYKNIRRLYKKSYANIVVNKRQSSKLLIKRGIKQGCPLSMMLYIIAIDELLVRIGENEDIKGYKVRAVREFEIKTSAYADDVVGYVVDEASIEHFFSEFEKWGRVSGASLNKEKTKLIRIGVESEESEDVKILGVYFNKQGLSGKNIKAILDKIRSTIAIWSTVKQNMLERIVVCKTFILSKIWFIEGITVIEEKTIKKINKIMIKYIYNNAIELMKRDAIILPYDRGGFEMFHLKAKIETINIQQFIYIRRNYERMFYCMSVYWMKFLLRDLNMPNFNLVRCGSDAHRPIYYEKMSECVRAFRKKQFASIQNIYNISSKKTYEIMRAGYEKHPSCERMSWACEIDWKSVYKKLNDKKLPSDLRVNNILVANNAISLNFKINKRENKCSLCQRSFESLEHIFLDCSFSKYILNKISFEKNFNFNKETIFLNQNVTEKDSFLISVYKYVVWKVRNICIYKEIINKRALAENLISKWLKK